MFFKLIQIFLVLSLGVLFACLFSVPVRHISCFYGKQSSFLKKKKKLRNITAVITWYGFLLFFLITVFLLFYFNISQYFSRISWNEFMEMATSTVNRVLSVFPFLKNAGIEDLAADVLNALMKLPGIIGKIVVAIMISIYLLMDWNYYVSGFQKWKKDCLDKKTSRTITIIIRDTKDVLFGYLKGQSMDALVMGVLLSIGLWLLHVPLGICIGILAGIGNLVPYVGPVIAFSFTAFFCLIEKKISTLIISILYLIVIQQIDSSFIGPKLLGKQMKIRPLFVIVSILVGGTLFGPIGMLFAVPAAAIIKCVIKTLHQEYCRT